MDRDEAMRILRAHERELRALGITRLALFGSVARGDARPDSDVDVMVDIEPGRRFSLLDLAGLHVLLCDIIGSETDVVIREDMRPAFRQRIADDLLPVF
jgi:uncharacterized protein